MGFFVVSLTPSETLTRQHAMDVVGVRAQRRHDPDYDHTSLSITPPALQTSWTLAYLQALNFLTEISSVGGAGVKNGAQYWLDED